MRLPQTVQIRRRCVMTFLSTDGEPEAASVAGRCGAGPASRGGSGIPRGAAAGTACAAGVLLCTFVAASLCASTGASEVEAPACGKRILSRGGGKQGMRSVSNESCLKRADDGCQGLM